MHLKLKLTIHLSDEINALGVLRFIAPLHYNASELSHCIKDPASYSAARLLFVLGEKFCSLSM